MRIGILNSGGDCPGLNTVIHGVVGAAAELGWEVIGFKDGFEGLLPPGDYVTLTPKDTRACTLGHLQRGGAPTVLDRILAMRFGVMAVKLAEEGRFGQMVSYQAYHVDSVPIEEAVHELRLVRPESELVHAAKAVGICFGD